MGAPGNTPPTVSQPSSLCRWTSYQATGPSQGWCELTSRRVAPSLEREGATAKVLDPGSGSGEADGEGGVRVSANSSRRVLSRPKNRGVLCTKPATTSRPLDGYRPGRAWPGCSAA